MKSPSRAFHVLAAWCRGVKSPERLNFADRHDVGDRYGPPTELVMLVVRDDCIRRQVVADPVAKPPVFVDHVSLPYTQVLWKDPLVVFTEWTRMVVMDGKPTAIDDYPELTICSR